MNKGKFAIHKNRLKPICLIGLVSTGLTACLSDGDSGNCGHYASAFTDGRTGHFDSQTLEYREESSESGSSSSVEYSSVGGFLDEHHPVGKLTRRQSTLITPGPIITVSYEYDEDGRLALSLRTNRDLGLALRWRIEWQDYDDAGRPTRGIGSITAGWGSQSDSETLICQGLEYRLDYDNEELMRETTRLAGALTGYDSPDFDPDNYQHLCETNYVTRTWFDRTTRAYIRKHTWRESIEPDGEPDAETVNRKVEDKRLLCN